RLETELEKRRIDKPVEEQDVSFEVKGNRKKGHRVLELKNVRKAFEEHQLFEKVSFTVQAGDRIACIGANGSGKSTLFQMILGHESYYGELWLTKGMTIGYMSQHIIDLPSDQTLSEFFHTETFDEQGRVRIELSNLGFDEAHWNIPIRDLSQGERVKVKLMEFIRKGTDILLLDEPTNHLDLPSREQLENTLATFPGTLIFASHDKYFTKNMGTSLLVFEDKKIQKAPMTLEEWQERQSHPNAQNIDNDEERLRIETELQAVLGELILIHEDDPSYHQLDQTFKELSNKLKKIT